tara:strand:+ start:889 stop:1620 length:732 start_codon:yes stop_codon:yes gene_type:complete
MKTKKGTIESFLKLLPKEKQEEQPSFHDLWDQAVKAIDILKERHPSEYWERATQSTHVPLLFPRRKEDGNEFLKELTRKGVRWNKRGNRRDRNHPMNREVETVYNRVFEYKCRLHMAERNGIKFDEKKHPIAKPIIKLPRFRTKTFPRWKKWLVRAFIEKHNGAPEKSEELLQLFKFNVDYSADKKGKEIDRRKLTRNEHSEEIEKGRKASARAYRRVIKKDFVDKAEIFAKEMSWLWGDKQS